MKQRELSTFSTSDTPLAEPLANPKKNNPISLHRRPALTVAILFIAGIALGRAIPVAVGWWLAAAVVAWLTSAILNRYGAVASWMLAAMVILGGICAEQLDRSAYSENSIAHYTTDQPRLARLRLRITDPPRNVQGQWHQTGQVTRAAVLAVQCRGGWRLADGEITLHLYNGGDTLAFGQRIEALGWITRPPLADNPGEFDWLSYYRHERILANFQITEPRCLRVLGHNATNPLWRFRQSARELLLRGFSTTQSLDAAVLDALVLGDRQTQERDIQDLFIQTGTPHLMVISGMHIFIVAAFVYLLCRLTRLRPRVTAMIVMGCVILYGLLVLPSLPAARAVLFCVLTLLGIIFRRSIDLLQLLAICAIAILVIHPMDLSDAGFQLSFVTVFVLIVYGERAMEWMQGLLIDPADLAANFFIQPRQTRIWRMVRNAFISAAVAWLAIMPFILFYFNRLNPWAIFGGVTLVPFVFIGVIGGLAKILLTLLLPWFASFWAMLAVMPIYLLIHSVGWLARLPASDVLAPPPPIWIIALYYALLLLPLIPWRSNWKFMRLSPLAGLALLALPWIITIFRPVTELRLTILSVGAGSCAIAESPDGHAAIFDAGSSTIADLERTVIKPFLRHEQIHRIDDLFISHPDADHYNAVQPTIEDFDTHEIILDSAFAADAQGRYGARRLLDGLDQMHRSPRIVAAGEQIHLGRDVTIDVLWPPPSSHWGHNDDGMVQRIRYAGRSILIPGDIESIAERQLINLCPSLPSDILIAPHHGSSVDTTPFFIQTVNPRYIISSNDRTPTSKQKRFLTELDGRPLYATNQCGAVTITIDSHGQMAATPFLFQLKHP